MRRRRDDKKRIFFDLWHLNQLTFVKSGTFLAAQLYDRFVTSWPSLFQKYFLNCVLLILTRNNAETIIVRWFGTWKWKEIFKVNENDCSTLDSSIGQLGYADHERRNKSQSMRIQCHCIGKVCAPQLSMWRQNHISYKIVPPSQFFFVCRPKGVRNIIEEELNEVKI